MVKVGLFANPNRTESVEWAERAAVLLNDASMEVCVFPEVAQKLSSSVDFVYTLSVAECKKFADVVMTFGGDGTFLMAARAFADTQIPILGVNLGKLGFLAEISMDELDEAVSFLKNKDYRVEERILLEATVHLSEQSRKDTPPDTFSVVAANDIVFHRQSFERLINVHAFVDGHRIADYRADGLIISTPTGSTAYSLSSGGPVISPSCSVFGITPVAPHSLTLRPLVIPDNCNIRLQTYSEQGSVNLVADGQVVHEVQNGQEIMIKKASSTMKLVKRTNSSYYELLKQKLLWSVHTAKL